MVFVACCVRALSTTPLTAADEAHFPVCVPVAVSPQFYAWLFGFGEEAVILAPESVRQQMQARAAAVAAQYAGGTALQKAP